MPDDEVELRLPSGKRLRLPITALMHQTGMSREEVLAAADTIAGLNLANPDEN
jgi:hypothetical protein